MDTDLALQKSQFIQVLQDGGHAIIWHSLFGRPRVVTDDTLRFLEMFSQPRSLSSLRDEYDVTEGVTAVVSDLQQNSFLVPNGFDERAFLAQQMQEHDDTITSGEKIDYLELIMSEACNFRCAYCIHFSNLEASERIGNPNKFMKFGMAKQSVDGFLKILRSHGKKTAVVNFGGGEPLLAWQVMRQVLGYCRVTYGDEFQLDFSVNTNCSLIMPEVATILKEYGVRIAASLDGVREANDLVRLTIAGQGTFDQVTRGFKNLADAGYPLDGFSVTVNERNFPEVDERVIDWAAKHAMREVRIDIDVVGLVNVPLSEIVDRLMRIRRYASSMGIDVPGFWRRPAENLNLDTLQSCVAFCGAVRGNSMCVSPSGGIYACGYSTTQLGMLAQIKSFTAAGGDYHSFVRDHLTGTMEMCKGCAIEGQCGGGCNITIEHDRSTNAVDKVERMCEFYREMTRQILLENLRSVAI